MTTANSSEPRQPLTYDAVGVDTGLEEGACASLASG